MAIADLPLRRIVSGGQTGVDRAALDVAIELGIEHGGWCPCGRRAEDGTIPARYQLVELASPHYADRTERNVLDSDATLILHRGPIAGGTLLTLQLAQRYGRQYFTVDLGGDTAVATDRLREWLMRHQIVTLNVAGPRESQSPGIHATASCFLRAALGS